MILVDLIRLRQANGRVIQMVSDVFNAAAIVSFVHEKGGIQLC